MTSDKLNIRSFASRFLLGICVVSLLISCGGGNTDSMVKSAKDYVGKSDYKAAAIQVKNALQKDPNLPEARFLLGSILLSSGDVPAAELELRKALELKYSADLVVPLLAKAITSQGNFKKLTDEFSATTLTAPRSNAELQSFLASAYSAQGKNDLAEKALKAAFTAEADFIPAINAQARHKAVLLDFDGALALADGVIAKDDKNLEAWKLKGDLLYFAKSKPTEALIAFRKLLEIKPDLPSAHNSILTILLAQGDLEGATKQLSELKKFTPNHPQTRFFQAQLAYQKRDFKAAREQIQQLLPMAPNNPRALQLAGATEFQLNSMVQAEATLTKALNAAPEMVLARRLLVMTYLRTGQPTKALATLNQGISKGIVDPEGNSIAGEVYLQNGDLKKAEEFFAKAAKLSPGDARKKTSLALARMLTGKEDAAFGELEEIASSDSGITADMALISAHLRRSEWDKALLAIDKLEKKQPDKPLAANLRGRTLLFKQDLPGARKSFERALVLDPSYFPAISSLSNLALSEKKPEEAKKLFENLLAKEPKNAQAFLGLAEIAAKSGAPHSEVAGLLTKAINASPSEPGPRVLLVDYLLRNKDEKQAVSVAQGAVTSMPESAEALDALGRSQQATGEFNQAIATYGKLSDLQPNSPMPFMRMADLFLASKNNDSAAQSLRKALIVKPDLIDAQRGLITLGMEAKKISESVAIARTVQKQRPKESIGYIFEGDISAAQKKWDEAASIYRVGLKEAPGTELALKLHTVLLASAKAAEADKFSGTWLKENPKDGGYLFYMGDLAVARKDMVAAEKSYLGVIKLQPNNAAAFNNLAWVFGQLKKDGAIAYAETAIKLAPNQPAFMDTMAMLLSEKNDYTKAVEWQSKAIAAQPQNTLFKLNIAKIHIKGGQKELARKELGELAKLGNKFPAQAEVDGLLKAL